MNRKGNLPQLVIELEKGNKGIMTMGTVLWIPSVEIEETMSIFCRVRPLLGPPPLRRSPWRSYKKDCDRTTNGLIQPCLAIKSISIGWFGGAR